jgi:hypothetical protein
MPIKRIWMLLMALVMLMTLNTALASPDGDDYEGDDDSYYNERLETMDTVTSGDWVYTLLADGTISLERYVGEAMDIAVPETLDGLPVTVVGSYCFPVYAADRVTLPPSITALAVDAFLFCPVKEVVLNEGLKTIGDTAFFGCDLLAAVAVPSTVESIGLGAFQNCPMLMSVTLPEGITVLPDNLLIDCSSLNRLAVPASVQTIGVDVFPEQKTFVLVAPAGSYAQTYAQEHGIPFEVSPS